MSFNVSFYDVPYEPIEYDGSSVYRKHATVLGAVLGAMLLLFVALIIFILKNRLCECQSRGNASINFLGFKLVISFLVLNLSKATKILLLT